MKPEMTRYDINKLLMVVPNRLEQNKFLTSSEVSRSAPASRMKWGVLALLIMALFTFYGVEPKPISTAFWMINACLVLTFIFYVYYIWGRPTLLPTFLVALDKNKVYPGDEVSVNIIAQGDRSLIEAFTVSLVLRECLINVVALSTDAEENTHYAYREVLHQSAKVDVSDIHFVIPKYLHPSLRTNYMQMVNDPSAKKNQNNYSDINYGTDIFLEWAILIECKLKYCPLLKRHYCFTVLPFEESQNDNKNNLEYF